MCREETIISLSVLNQHVSLRCQMFRGVFSLFRLRQEQSAGGWWIRQMVARDQKLQVEDFETQGQASVPSVIQFVSQNGSTVKA